MISNYITQLLSPRSQLGSWDCGAVICSAEHTLHLGYPRHALRFPLLPSLSSQLCCPPSTTCFSFPQFPRVSLLPPPSPLPTLLLPPPPWPGPHLWCEQPHAERGGIDDPQPPLLEVGHQAAWGQMLHGHM